MSANRFGPVLETHCGVGQLRHPKVEAQSFGQPARQLRVVEKSAGTVNEQKSTDHAGFLSSAILSPKKTGAGP